MESLEKKYYIYFYYDDADTLLYIGKSIDVWARWKQHKEDPWINEVKKIGVVECDDIPSMDILERYFIARHKTKYNKAGTAKGYTSLDLMGYSQPIIYDLAAFTNKYAAEKVQATPSLEKQRGVDARLSAQGYIIIETQMVDLLDPVLLNMDMDKVVFKYKDMYLISRFSCFERRSTNRRDNNRKTNEVLLFLRDWLTLQKQGEYSRLPTGMDVRSILGEVYTISVLYGLYSLRVRNGKEMLCPIDECECLPLKIAVHLLDGEAQHALIEVLERKGVTQEKTCFTQEDFIIDLFRIRTETYEGFRQQQEKWEELQEIVEQKIRNALLEDYNKDKRLKASFLLVKHIATSIEEDDRGDDKSLLLNITFRDGICPAPEYIYSETACEIFHTFLSPLPPDFNAIEYSDYLVHRKLPEIISLIQGARPSQYPLYVLDLKRSREDTYAALDRAALQAYGFPYNALSMEEKRSLNDFVCMRKLKSGDELISELRKFIAEHDRYPFKTEPLYRTLEYASEVAPDFLSERNRIDIAELRNAMQRKFALKNLKILHNFCNDNRRWPYNEKEVGKALHYVRRYFRFGVYTKEEEKGIDELYASFANNESKGEYLVNAYLVSKGYTDLRKHISLPDCRDKRPLSFDTMFYVDQQMCLIEYDGKQHFEPITYFGGNQNFEYVKKHDTIKNEYCQKNGIPLLRIPYTHVKQIPELINEFIQCVKKGEVLIDCCGDPTITY